MLTLTISFHQKKLDSSFPEEQFLIPGYGGYGTSYNVARNCHGGGVTLFLNTDIPSELLSAVNTTIECFYIKLNLL